MAEVQQKKQKPEQETPQQEKEEEEKKKKEEEEKKKKEKVKPCYREVTPRACGKCEDDRYQRKLVHCKTCIRRIGDIQGRMEGWPSDDYDSWMFKCPEGEIGEEYLEKTDRPCEGHCRGVLP